MTWRVFFLSFSAVPVNKCNRDVTTTTANRIVFRPAEDTPLTPNLFALVVFSLPLPISQVEGNNWGQGERNMAPGRLADLRPPELADWPFANRHARPFLAVSAAKQQSSLHLVRPSCAAPRCSRSEHQTRTLWQFYRCRCSTRRSRPAGDRSDGFGPCRGADRLAPPTGVSLGFLAEILPFQTLSELRTVA